jgi:hypothetical protein
MIRNDRDNIPEPLLYLRNLDKDLIILIYVPLPVPTGPVISNISHSPPGPIPITVSKPFNGTLSINQNSTSVAYIPNPNFHGKDSFTVKIN